MLDNHQKITNHLNKRIPELEKKALIGGKYLQKILEY